MLYQSCGVAIPSVPGTWENSLYGGDVFAWKDYSHLLYSAPGPGMANAIGLAESEDLLHWTVVQSRDYQIVFVNGVLAATYSFSRRDAGVVGLMLENATGTCVVGGIHARPGPADARTDHAARGKPVSLAHPVKLQMVRNQKYRCRHD
ncbi:MAG: hypothetical protein NTW21_34895 [Verrucomicrobia bacterium]|nr:hypothetical protein [Verrucomicrobiota bacterium]